MIQTEVPKRCLLEITHSLGEKDFLKMESINVGRRKNHEDQYDTDSMDSQSLIRYMPKKFFLETCPKRRNNGFVFAQG